MVRLASVLGVVGALVFVGSAYGRTTSVDLRNTQQSKQRASAARVVRTVPTLEERLVAAINEFRLQNGLRALRINPELAAVAREHSLSMAEDGYFEHASPTGSPFWYRIEAKYAGSARRYWSVGENLAWRSPKLSAKLTLQLWMKSPEHLENLLRPGWRDIGVGGVYVHPAPGIFAGRAATIVTADFGVRR